MQQLYKMWKRRLLAISPLLGATFTIVLFVRMTIVVSQGALSMWRLRVVLPMLSPYAMVILV